MPVFNPYACPGVVLLMFWRRSDVLVMLCSWSACSCPSLAALLVFFLLLWSSQAVLIFACSGVPLLMSLCSSVLLMFRWCFADFCSVAPFASFDHWFMCSSADLHSSSIVSLAQMLMCFICSFVQVLSCSIVQSLNCSFAHLLNCSCDEQAHRNTRTPMQMSAHVFCSCLADSWLTCLSWRSADVLLLFLCSSGVVLVMTCSHPWVVLAMQGVIQTDLTRACIH